MNKAFYKGAAVGAIMASIAVGCISKQPEVTVEQLQL